MARARRANAKSCGKAKYRQNKNRQIRKETNAKRTDSTRKDCKANKEKHIEEQVDATETEKLLNTHTSVPASEATTLNSNDHHHHHNDNDNSAGNNKTRVNSINFMELQESSLQFWIKSMCESSLCESSVNTHVGTICERVEQEHEKTENAIATLKDLHTANTSCIVDVPVNGKTVQVAEQQNLEEEEEERQQQAKQYSESKNNTNNEMQTNVHVAILRNALPLFSAIVNNELGNVVIDVVIVGQTSLLRQPQAFAKVLDAHAQADSAALRRLLHSVTLFIMTQHFNLYYLDSENAPLVVLMLAHLLASQSVTKIGLHTQLLTRLLLLYLGSDRVQVEKFVDLHIWSACMEQSINDICVFANTKNFTSESDKDNVTDYVSRTSSSNLAQRDSFDNNENHINDDNYDQGEKEDENDDSNHRKYSELSELHHIREKSTNTKSTFRPIDSIDQVYKTLSESTLQAINIQVERLVRWLHTTHLSCKESKEKNNNNNGFASSDKESMTEESSKEQSESVSGQTNSQEDEDKEEDEIDNNTTNTGKGYHNIRASKVARSAECSSTRTINEEQQESELESETAVDILSRITTRATPIHNKRNALHKERSTCYNSTLYWTSPQNEEFVSNLYRDLLAIHHWCDLFHVVSLMAQNECCIHMNREHNNCNNNSRFSSDNNNNNNEDNRDNMLSKNAMLYALAERRTQVNMLCAMMTFHGIFISKQRYDMMQRDVQAQVNQLIAIGNDLLRTQQSTNKQSNELNLQSVTSARIGEHLEEPSPHSPEEEMTSSTSTLQVEEQEEEEEQQQQHEEEEEQRKGNVDEKVKEQQRMRRQRAQQRLQLQLKQKRQVSGRASLSASRIKKKIEHMTADGVMRNLLEHLRMEENVKGLSEEEQEQHQEQQEEELIETASHNTKHTNVITNDLDKEETPHLQSSLLTEGECTLEEIRKIVEREGLLASRKPGETATLQLKRLVERLQQLHVNTQLGVVWLALQERRSFMKYLSDLFSVNCKLLVHILPACTSAESEINSTSNINNSSNNNNNNKREKSKLPFVCFSLHPHWQVHITTTGRIFASFPNMQTLPKLPPTAKYSVDSVISLGHTSESSRERNDNSDFISNNYNNNNNSNSNNNEKSSIAIPVLMLREHCDWTVRHLCIAPPNCVLVSLDYNQIELRVLAHMSRDAKLIRQLSSGTDVLRAVAHTVLYSKSELEINNNSNNKINNANDNDDKEGNGNASTAKLTEESSNGLQQEEHEEEEQEYEYNENTETVTPLQRQAIKVIVYGLIYGMGVRSMEDKIAELRSTELWHSPVSVINNINNDSSNSNSNSADKKVERSCNVLAPLSAHHLIRLFYKAYPQVETYLRQTRMEACSKHWVQTITGYKNLSHITDLAKRRQNSVAWAIQGGAADLLQEAMIAIHKQRHSIIPITHESNNYTNTLIAPFALMMAAHDELIYAVPSHFANMVIPELAVRMTNVAEQWNLRVPLKVSVRVGSSLGELREIALEYRKQCEQQGLSIEKKKTI